MAFGNPQTFFFLIHSNLLKYYSNLIRYSKLSNHSKIKNALKYTFLKNFETANYDSFR